MLSRILLARRLVGLGLGLVPVSVTLLASPSAAVAAPPVNDDVANAVVWTGETSFVGTNVDATKETGEPNHAGNAGGASIWYQGTPPIDGTATITTCGSSFDTLLAVYSASGPVPPFTNLTPVASNDDSCGSQSSVTFPAAAGTNYYVAVDGFGGATGTVSLSLTVTFGPPPPPPPPGPPGPPPFSPPFSPPPDAGSFALPEADCPAQDRYVGTTSQGEKICFTLSGKKVAGLEFTIRASCTSGSLEQFTEFTKPLTASRNLRNPKVRKFSFSDDELELKGKIKGSKANGTLELAGSSVAGFCQSGNVGWNAQKG